MRIVGVLAFMKVGDSTDVPRGGETSDVERNEAPAATRVADESRRQQQLPEAAGRPHG
jgi:hypothetical protein